MIRSLLAVLKDEIAALPWLEAATSGKALAKLAAYNPQVGYPDVWRDYSHIELRRTTLWANIATLRRFNTADDHARIGKPTDPNWWQLPPFSSDAYIDAQLNEMVLPAGFLQAPAFDLDATDAVNYGAFGAGVAHDLTHSIDITGAELDSQGRPNNWWSERDRQQFSKVAQCVSDQFDGYDIEPGMHESGKIVLNEAIGDLAGERLAYWALERSLADHPVPVVDGFTPQQQFFVATGQWRGEAVRIEAAREMLKRDPHPLPKFRVIGPLSNMPEFQRAFSCPEGAAMVRAEKNRCMVW